MKALCKCFVLLAIPLLMSRVTFAAEQEVVVQIGMRGDKVKQVQELLLKTGFLKGKADGAFGGATKKAVQDFQESVELTSSGKVDTRTLETLKQYKPRRKFDDPKEKRLREQYKRKLEVPQGKTLPSQPEQYRFTKTIKMIATAYTRYDEGCTDYTYRGTYLRRGLVAVDPSVIPLGTKLYIPGYGHAIADDIGGAIRGYRIDLAMETVEEAFRYGRREVMVYIAE